MGPKLRHPTVPVHKEHADPVIPVAAKLEDSEASSDFEGSKIVKAVVVRYMYPSIASNKTSSSSADVKMSSDCEQ
jgi:hypothetical protein